MGVYEQLGLEPIINASGSVTRLGGAPMQDEVLEAYRAAAGESVPLEQLQAAASRRIAQLTGTEAGLVTCGSAAALMLGAAAILAGYDLGRIERLPHCDGFPNELIIAREQRSGYDHAIRASGARLVEVGFNELVAGAGVRRTEVWEYEAAIGPATAGLVYVYSPTSRPKLDELVQIAHRHGLPVLVDAAGELPPRENLVRISATGADLVAFSGGKAVRGPQASGLLCGRRDLIGSAAVQFLDMDDHYELWNPPAELIDKQKLGGIPRHGIGRMLKVSKEEIVAQLTALELFASGAYNAERKVFLGYLISISEGLAGLPATSVLRERPDGESLPWLEVVVDQVRAGKSALDICRNLRSGSPPVYVGHSRLSEGILEIHPLCLNETRTQQLLECLSAELTS